MTTAATLTTTEQLLVLPDDGTDRWLIAGELRERPRPDKQVSQPNHDAFGSFPGFLAG
jgi:hypothetical protein